MEKKALIKEEHAMTAERGKAFGPTKKLLGVLTFLKKDPVLTVSWILAIGSAFWIPPDSAYLDYLDLQTLGLLFCLMTITGGLQNMGIFSRIGGNLIRHVANTASLAGILVALCFFSSMIITNDVALITFVPFTMVILDMVGKKEKMIPVVTMQTIAANLGSMVTPIGNPQNLYLYSQTDMGLIPFIRITLPYAAVTAFFFAAVSGRTKKRKDSSCGNSDGQASSQQEKRVDVCVLVSSGIGGDYTLDSHGARVFPHGSGSGGGGPKCPEKGGLCPTIDVHRIFYFHRKYEANSLVLPDADGGCERK